MHKRSIISCALLPALLTLSAARSMAQEYPLEEDVATLEGIMKAYYEVVSGPAGQPAEKERDLSLHHPAARLMVIRGHGNSGASNWLNRRCG